MALQQIHLTLRAKLQENLADVPTQFAVDTALSGRGSLKVMGVIMGVMLVGDFQKRSLADCDYVYIWVDGIDVTLHYGEDRPSSSLMVIGARPDGTKGLIGNTDGYRESSESWLDGTATALDVSASPEPSKRILFEIRSSFVSRKSVLDALLVGDASETVQKLRLAPMFVATLPSEANHHNLQTKNS